MSSVPSIVTVRCPVCLLSKRLTPGFYGYYTCDGCGEQLHLSRSQGQVHVALARPLPVEQIALLPPDRALHLKRLHDDYRAAVQALRAFMPRYEREVAPQLAAAELDLSVVHLLYGLVGIPAVLFLTGLLGALLMPVFAAGGLVALLLMGSLLAWLWSAAITKRKAARDKARAIIEALRDARSDLKVKAGALRDVLAERLDTELKQN